MRPLPEMTELTRTIGKFVQAILLVCFAGNVMAQEVSQEARKHLVRAQTAAEMAKTNHDYEGAILEFQKAIELAPAWAEPYYQIGILQDQLGKYDEALSNLTRYLQLAPNASNVVQVQDLCYKIEYKRDKANQKRNIVAAMTGKLQKKGGCPMGVCWLSGFTQVGDEIKATISSVYEGWGDSVPVEFDGAVIKFTYMYYHCPNLTEKDYFPCPWQVSVVAEVISTSPLRFKTKEAWQQKFGDNAKNYYEAEWEFRQ